jgi:hypothetical protein
MRYRWNLERLPGWQVALLEDMGLPLEFDPEELTDEQCRRLQFVMLLRELVERGLIRPEYRDGSVTFSVTEEGERLLGEMRDG